jgi:hypothetical protein
MKRHSMLIILTTVIVMSVAAPLFAAMPTTINYQGFLTSATGTPAKGPLSMTFSLYSSNPARNNPVWSETQPAVAVTNGIYSVQLGSVAPITAPFDAPYWMGIRIGSDPELTPLQPLNSTGYAFRSKTVDINCPDGAILVYMTAGGWECGTVNTFPNAAGTCIGSKCFINSCSSGWGNCDNIVVNGCETNLLTSQNNCGSCGTACPAGANASSSCQSGICSPFSCNAGYLDCNNNPSDGCETNAASDLNNCGACGKVCPAAPSNGQKICNNSICGIACNTPGQTPCGNNCIDTTTDLQNCGSCGTVCVSGANGTPVCAASQCSLHCNNGYSYCAGSCLNLANDTNHCGNCNTACPFVANGTNTCNNGLCGIGSCNAGYADCDMNPANGCEVNTQSDVTNCGQCGRVCSTQNIIRSCTAGSCSGTCTFGYADCNGNKQTDGCETNILNSVTNCGGCGIVCSSNHITPNCGGGVCNGACAAGYADCNGNKQSDGCETNTMNNDNNCGSCGTVCPAGQHCTAGVCG